MKQKKAGKKENYTFTGFPLIYTLNTSGPPGAIDWEFDSKFAYIVLLVLLLVLCCGLLHACVDRPQEVSQLPVDAFYGRRDTKQGVSGPAPECGGVSRSLGRPEDVSRAGLGSQR